MDLLNSSIDWFGTVSDEQIAELRRKWGELAENTSHTLILELTRPGFAFTPAPDLDPVEAYFAADLIAAE